jgi:hypothetical protein
MNDPMTNSHRGHIADRKSVTRKASRADMGSASPRGSPPGACAIHFFRKGYYQNSSADYRCVICGLEASTAEVDQLDLADTTQRPQHDDLSDEDSL